MDQLSHSHSVCLCHRKEEEVVVLEMMDQTQNGDDGDSASLLPSVV